MKSVRYLDEVMNRHGLKNDRQLALHLKWNPSVVHQYRTGKRVMEEEKCLQLARELGMENPLPVIAAAGIDRAEKTGQRSLWEVFTKATSLSPLAVALLVGVTSIVTSPAAEAATAQTSGICNLYYVNK